MAYAIGLSAVGDIVASNYAGAIITTSPASITPAAGSRLVGIVWYIAASAKTFTASGGLGNTWARVGGHFNTDSGIEVYEVLSCANVATVFSATVTSGTVDFPAVAIVEISGLDTAFASDGYAGQRDSTGSGSDGLSSGNVTPAVQPSIILGVAVDYSTSATPSTGTGANNIVIGANYGGGTFGLRVTDKRVTSLSAVDATFGGNGGSGPWDVAAIVIRESGAGGGDELMGAMCL